MDVPPRGRYVCDEGHAALGLLQLLQVAAQHCKRRADLALARTDRLQNTDIDSHTETDTQETNVGEKECFSGSVDGCLTCSHRRVVLWRWRVVRCGRPCRG